MSIEHSDLVDIISVAWSGKTSGEILESYPNAKGRIVAFRVVFKYGPTVWTK